ncbi:formate dehydrogenase accessory sulfurtransferase FdhD [Bradyrhizobium sp. CCGUVB14]|uniref:formate dehydrogenase accessory sulfurtransferase FdhD n=1 Tax=Bradyrhizobium sp. CCGUVB14 TaxID=2949628 RepID=UPI0020B1E25F|nr:formate dehydrogenase accessory sulfurtransferase FdhD [Bradyrhizobium sp. CCGUVB14]MCP3442291.1 formate dehydrogenase accessory sulfurtransferase FdhD [Bradyrhizobium sp. CCGUVB14]
MHGSKFRRQANLPHAVVGVDCHDQDGQLVARQLAEETPVALAYNGTTFAVVMATPADLTDLALGFSLTEGIIAAPSEIENLDVVRHEDGVELRMWITSDRSDRLMARRRRLVGPTGCGLCGIESLADACPPVPSTTTDLSLTAEDISSAMHALTAAQDINRATRATHAAGLYQPCTGQLLLREDVGRHNALDKLAGAMAAEGVDGSSGALVLTSRVSIELVQKAAAIGIGILIAVSAPTALAVRTAIVSGMTLIGIARGSDFQIFSEPGRIR